MISPNTARAYCIHSWEAGRWMDLAIDCQLTVIMYHCSALAGYLVSMLFSVSPGRNFSLQMFFYPDSLSFSVQKYNIIMR